MPAKWGGPFSALLLCHSSLEAPFSGANAIAQDRPNIVRISAGDVGPHLAAYNDPHANTPHLDSLTDRGMTYRYVWSSLPVCTSAPFY
jgi:uncharacterized sulfatase